MSSWCGARDHHLLLSYSFISFVFVLHLFSFQSLVIEVAVAVLLLVSLLFILLRSFGRGALLDSPVWSFFPTLFPFTIHFQSLGRSLFRRLFEKVKRLVAKRFAPTGLLCICWVGSWARARSIHCSFTPHLLFLEAVRVHGVPALVLEYPFSYSPLSCLE